MMRRLLAAAAIVLCTVAPLPALKIEISDPLLRPFRVFAPQPALQRFRSLADTAIRDLRTAPNVELVESKEQADFAIAFDEESASLVILSVTDLKTQTIRSFRVIATEQASGGHLAADRAYEAITGERSYFTQTMVFSMNWNGVRQVFMSDIAGRRLQRLTNNSTDSIACKLSPDGSRIVYTLYGAKSGSTALRLIDLSTREDRALHVSAGINIAGGFSDDGKTVYFSSYDGKTSRIMACGIDGDRREQLFSSSSRLVSPVATGTAGRLAVVSDQHGSPQIFLLNLADRKLQRVAQRHTYATAPAFTRTGDAEYRNFFAYLGQSGGKNGVYISSIDGSFFTVLSHRHNYEELSWLRNERFILTHARTGKGSTVYLIDVPTLREIELFTLPAQIGYLSAG